MQYSEALEMLKTGVIIAREGWASKGKYLYYIPSGTEDDPIIVHCDGVDDTQWRPDIKDLLAKDWMMPAMAVGRGFGRGISM